MERKQASDFPQELLDLFHLYVHGDIDRRAFLDRAGKFAVGGLTAVGASGDAQAQLRLGAAGAEGRQADPDRVRDRAVAAGQRLDQGLSGSSSRRASRRSIPPCSSCTRTAGSIRISRTSRGAWALTNFIAFAPDGLTSVGGYPGDDEKGGQLFGQVDRAKMTGGLRRRGRLAEGASRQHRQARRRRLLLRRRHREHARGAHAGPRRGGAVLRRAAARGDVPKIKAAVLVHHGELDTRLAGRGPPTTPR